MEIAAILLAARPPLIADPTWVIQSANLGMRYLVKVDGKNCGRGRFVEARQFLTPWKCQARKFEDEAEANAFADVLEPIAGQCVQVVSWENAWHEEVLDVRWRGTCKIGPATADHDRPLLDLVRLYAEALECKLRLANIMPAALAFIDPTKAAGAGSPGGPKVSMAHRKLDAWRERLLDAGLPTTALLIVDGPAAEKIANETQGLGSRVIAIGAQHNHDNRLLGGLLRDQTALLSNAPCPVLISETAEVILT